jgi:hypothetical protein
MRKTLFNTKVKIEKKEKALSKENVWVSDYVFWKELWASVFLKDISPRRTLYFFTIKWNQDFPTAFRVKINNKIFTPIQLPVVDTSKDEILFHATMN